MRPNLTADRLGTAVLSLVLALIIWLVAVNQENPLITQDFQQRVPVTVLGLAENLVLVQDLSNEAVKLKIRAPRTSWETLDASDFRAVVDLTSLDPGQHDVPIKVTSVDPKVDILDVQRPQLRVTLDPLEHREVPVQVEIMDGTAFGYDYQQPVYSPMSVTVSGPASLVQQVSRARAEVYLRNAKAQVERVQNLTPVDTQNRPVTGITAEPTSVQVVVPVEQWPGRKEVAVRVKLSGRPSDGYRMSTVRVEPSTVVLQGDSTRLSQVPGYVETEPLSLDGATGDVRRRLRLILPEGVTSYDGDTVTATAGVTAMEGGVTLSHAIVLQGLGAGLLAEPALNNVDVILSGPVPRLDTLNSDDVYVVLDLNGLLAGTHSVKPKVALPDGIRVEGVIPETVEVVIKGADGSLLPAPGATLSALHTTAATTPTLDATGIVTGSRPLTPTQGRGPSQPLVGAAGSSTQPDSGAFSGPGTIPPIVGDGPLNTPLPGLPNSP